jgi:hypothetical protein
MHVKHQSEKILQKMAKETSFIGTASDVQLVALWLTGALHVWLQGIALLSQKTYAASATKTLGGFIPLQMMAMIFI